jgi:Fe-S-cluster containining protein
MDHKLCKDCKGYCCDDIGFTLSPEDLKERFNNRYSIFIFTHKDNIHPDGEVKEYKRQVYHYRCTEHNKETGKCNIYGGRPELCRTYPDNGFCGYESVKIKAVIEDRPKWFGFGMKAEDWRSGMGGSERFTKGIKRKNPYNDIDKKLNEAI